MTHAALILFFATSTLAATDVDAVVRAQIADSWGIDADVVVLDWGWTPRPEWAKAVEVVGSGSQGSFVVRVPTDSGRDMTFRIRAGHRAIEMVAARRLPRGTVLTAGDFVSREIFVWGPPEGRAEVQEGWVTQRVVEPGDALSPPAARAPWIVTSGAGVEASWSNGAVSIRLDAVAAGSAGLGEQVYVRTDSGRRMRGTVVGPGRVALGGTTSATGRSGE